MAVSRGAQMSEWMTSRFCTEWRRHRRRDQSAAEQYASFNSATDFTLAHAPALGYELITKALISAVLPYF